MNTILERAGELKEEFVDFVYDAEGELAEALETYAADQTRYRKIPQDMLVDEFLTRGRVGDQSPLDLFLQDQKDLSASDRQLIQHWPQAFTGLFVIEEVLPDGFQVMNWLTAKHYTVKPGTARTAAAMERLSPGEILVARITPLPDGSWMLSSAYSQLGKLGKPKLAVAIGNFKDNHKPFLYGDAPDLMEEAWRSVETYHQAFLDFFGGDEVTMPGYQLNKKLPEFQEVLTKRYLEAAGVDSSKSLDELAAEAEISEEELEEIAKDAGVDAEEAAKLFKKGSGKLKMMAPQVQLPDELKKAEQITLLADPRWGQMFLPSYAKLTTILSTEDWQSIEGADAFIRRELDKPDMNTFVWHRLAAQYPQSLERILQTVLERPDFKLSEDLDSLLVRHGKLLEPEIPEIASVPVHLHKLFEEAIAEVQKTKAKGKKKKKTGFGL